jgi:hypothetical protein
MDTIQSYQSITLERKAWVDFDLVAESPVVQCFAYRTIKRVLDIAITGLGLIVLSPLLLLIGLLVKLTSPGPLLYAWDVIGRGGRPFRGYKFRTMVHNADDLKSQLAHLNEMSGPVFKVQNDPRITPIGRWLRKYCGVSSRGICRWLAHVPLGRTNGLISKIGNAAKSASPRASPVCGRCAAGTESAALMNGSNLICSTLTIGR